MRVCMCGGGDPSVRSHLWSRKGSLGACVEALGAGPAWAPGQSLGLRGHRRPASTHGSRGLLAKGKCPRPTRPKGLFLPAVLVSYKSSLGQFAPTQIMRFAAIYRPFRDTRLRRRQPRDTTRAVPDAGSPGRAGSARFGGFCPLPSLRGILVLGLPVVDS